MSGLKKAKRYNDYFGFCNDRLGRAIEAHDNGEIDDELLENVAGAAHDARNMSRLALYDLKRHGG